LSHLYGLHGPAIDDDLGSICGFAGADSPAPEALADNSSNIASSTLMVACVEYQTP